MLFIEWEAQSGWSGVHCSTYRTPLLLVVVCVEQANYNITIIINNVVEIPTRFPRPADGLGEDDEGE